MVGGGHMRHISKLFTGTCHILEITQSSSGYLSSLVQSNGRHQYCPLDGPLRLTIYIKTSSIVIISILISLLITFITIHNILSKITLYWVNTMMYSKITQYIIKLHNIFPPLRLYQVSPLNPLPRVQHHKSTSPFIHLWTNNGPPLPLNKWLLYNAALQRKSDPNISPHDWLEKSKRIPFPTYTFLGVNKQLINQPCVSKHVHGMIWPCPWLSWLCRVYEQLIKWLNLSNIKISKNKVM